MLKKPKEDKEENQQEKTEKIRFSKITRKQQT
jgi:hypothetical protein